MCRGAVMLGGAGWLLGSLPLTAAICPPPVAAQVSPHAKPADAKPAAVSEALQPPAAGQALSPAETARRAEVVAQFGDTRITVGDLEDAIVAQNPFMQQRYLSRDAVDALLDRSLRFELLAAEAARRGYDKQPAVELAVKQNAVQALIKSQFDDKITPDSIPADAIKKYYDEHIGEFVRPESRRASVLVVATEAEAKALAAQAQGDDLRAFRELVRNKSIDQTDRQRGGDTRYFDAAGHLVDDTGPDVDSAVAQAAFALKYTGDTSAAFKTGSHYAVLKLTGERAAESQTVAQADERVRLRVWRERRQAAIDAELAELRKQLAPEVHPELVDAIRFEVVSPVPPSGGLPSAFPQTRPGPLPKAPPE